MAVWDWPVLGPLLRAWEPQMGLFWAYSEALPEPLWGQIQPEEG